MKKIIASVAIASPLLATHSVDCGAFYSAHHEKGYSYDLAGVGLRYEIGEDEGLNADGKVLASKDSDLLFISSTSSLLYRFSWNNLLFSPFIGAKSISHEVYNSKSYTGVISKVWCPIGFGLGATISKFYPELRFSFLVPLSHCYVESNEENMFGTKYALRSLYAIEGKCTYRFNDKYSSFLALTWEQDLHQKEKTLSGELYVTVRF